MRGDAPLHANAASTDHSMGVGLYLTGIHPSDGVNPSREDWLEQVAAWLEGHEEEPLMICRMGQTAEGDPALYVQIHPCAEDVEVRAPSDTVCVIVAKTSTAGPGYHIFVCKLLRQLGNHFRIDWDAPDEETGAGDETGYFFHEDVEAVRVEMQRWLSALSRVVVENCKDDDVGLRMVSMPLDYSYPGQTGILTPIGPRTPEWFDEMIKRPERGADFFPWWPEGVGSAFFLGRALCHLWQDVRWRVPITEDEGEALMDAHLDLERAYHLDPHAAIPWREWNELLQYIQEYFGYAEFQTEAIREEEIERRAKSAPTDVPLIGYRRGPVQVTLTGGWSIIIPGDLAEKWEENGESWSAWHQGRTLWFTSWSVKGEGEAKVQPREILDSRPWPEDGDIIEHEDESLFGRAVFMQVEEEGETMWNLKAYSAVAGSFALCNIYLRNRHDLDWAIDVWKSMRG